MGPLVPFVLTPLGINVSFSFFCRRFLMQFCIVMKPNKAIKAIKKYQN